MPSSKENSERLVFGGNSWIFCTSIVPAPGERDAWRATLPEKYDHETTIRQPGKFCVGGGGYVRRTNRTTRKAWSLHASQRNSVIPFRPAHPSRSSLVHGRCAWFPRIIQIRSDLHDVPRSSSKTESSKIKGNIGSPFTAKAPLSPKTLHLQVNGMLRDALPPPRSTSAVVFSPPEDSSAGSSQHTSVTSTPGNRTTKRTTPTGETRRRALRIGDQIEEEEIVSRGEVVTLTTVVPAAGLDEAEDGGDSASPGNGDVSVAD